MSKKRGEYVHLKNKGEEAEDEEKEEIEAEDKKSLIRFLGPKVIIHGITFLLGVTSATFALTGKLPHNLIARNDKRVEDVETYLKLGGNLDRLNIDKDCAEELKEYAKTVKKVSKMPDDELTFEKQKELTEQSLEIAEELAMQKFENLFGVSRDRIVITSYTNASGDDIPVVCIKKTEEDQKSGDIYHIYWGPEGDSTLPEEAKAHVKAICELRATDTRYDMSKIPDSARKFKDEFKRINRIVQTSAIGSYIFDEKGNIKFIPVNKEEEVVVVENEDNKGNDSKATEVGKSTNNTTTTKKTSKLPKAYEDFGEDR